MKNFPSALIKQKNTRGGLGNNLGTTLKNVASQALSNIMHGNRNEAIDLNSINNKFDEGYEILNVQHEVTSFNINEYTADINSGSVNEINRKIYESSLNSHYMIPNMSNGKEDNNNYVKFDDPFLYSSSLFDTINNYKYIMPTTIPNLDEQLFPIGDDKSGFSVLHSIVAPSLFNPYNGVNFNYITEGIPLINSEKTNIDGTVKDGISKYPEGTEGTPDQSIFNITGLANGFRQDIDITDCSIKHLVELSNEHKLGLATYRYIDFMFCKDLGKISNNHLITLRKFPHPIGDNIYEEAVPTNNKSEKNQNTANYDIGRLITWFGNDDNKLEDICKYNYNATWKPFTAQIQQKPSQQQDGDSSNLQDGFVNKIANAFSASNNKLVGQGFSNHYGLLQWSANKLHIPIIGNKNPQQYYDWELLSNYDQNRIYEPQDVIWDTHKYEGRLTFNQEITLTFRYVLRGYANINPKAAMLDLLGNIMEVTYRRGSFWGGQTKIYGPQGNNSTYDTANAFIDKSFDKLGGVWRMLRAGELTPNVIMGWLGNIMDSLGDMMGGAINAVTATVKDAQAALTGESANKSEDEKAAQKKAKEQAEKAVTWLEDSNKKYGWTNALKGMFKNQLGRPAMYAFNSLLSGEAVGPWHLTIGNPLNPIMSMGNMIMDAPAEVQHYGPLGLDDFPTEIRVTVQLKHGRPRDAVEIQKMYTKGRDAIYKPMNLIDVENYYNNMSAFGDIDANNKYVEETWSYEDKNGKHSDKYNASALNKLLRNV